MLDLIWMMIAFIIVFALSATGPYTKNILCMILGVCGLAVVEVTRVDVSRGHAWVTLSDAQSSSTMLVSCAILCAAVVTLVLKLRSDVLKRDRVRRQEFL